MQFIIIRGNPVYGFEYVGPFASHDDATRYINEEPYPANQWVAELVGPDPTGREP